MLHRKLGGLATALLMTAVPLSANAAELFVYHSWSAESEVSALNVLIDELAERDIAWSEIAIPHESESNVGLINLVTGGNPPDVFIESNPGFYRDLKGMGLAQPVTELFDSEGITENLPQAVVQSITVDGEIMKIPTAIHIDGMIYYNKAVAEAAGVDPASWTSLEDMWADQQKVEDAGYTFMAMGRRRCWIAGFVVNMATTFQDVAVDGLAVDIMEEDERARASGMMFGGQYIGNGVPGDHLGPIGDVMLHPLSLGRGVDLFLPYAERRARHLHIQ